MINRSEQTTGTITSKWSGDMDDGEASVADVDWWYTCGGTLCIEETELTGIARV